MSEGLVSLMSGSARDGVAVPCPKKGAMAPDRCREWQREVSCTCHVAVAFGCALSELVEPEPTPPPPLGATPVLALSPAERFKAWRAAQSQQPQPPAEPVEEQPVGVTTEGTDRMLEAMAEEPERQWNVAELAELRGSEPDVTRQALYKLLANGQIERIGRGLYRWAGDAGPSEPEAEPEGVVTEREAPLVARRTTRPEATEPAPAPAPTPSRARLRWLAEGLQAGHLTVDQFVDQVAS